MSVSAIIPDVTSSSPYRIPAGVGVHPGLAGLIGSTGLQAMDPFGSAIFPFAAPAVPAGAYQLAPYGNFGSALLGGAGNVVSGVTGIPGLGQLGSWLGGLSPFSAAPAGMMPAGAHQFAPYGAGGAAIGNVAGNLLSGLTGIPGLGGLGEGFGRVFAPFAAPAVPAGAHQFAPYGAGGAAIGNVAGNLLSGLTGIPGLGGLGEGFGRVFAPFAAPAVPAGAHQLAPYGNFGSALLGGAGNVVSDVTGIPGLGQLGSWLGGLSPFSAAPAGMMPAGAHQFAPYGAGGAAIGNVAGNLLSGLTGIPGLGGLGEGFGRVFAPFAAPAVPAGAYQLAPYGNFGSALLGGAGNVVSDVTGIPGLGQLGSWLGGLSPFSAAPGGMMPAGAHQLAPYGILGGLIGSLGGSVLGDAIGIPGLGTAGGALGGILIPLSAQQAAAQQAAAQQLAAAQQIAAQHAAVRQHQNAVDALTCGGQPYAGINPHLWQQRWVAC